jgi:acyl carrier protein
MAHSFERPNLREQIVLLISKQTGVPPNRILLTTRLLQDLGLDGDDAEELLLAFAKAFDVDMTSLVFSRHFRGEPHLLSVWRGKDIKALALITISDLERSALRKRFVEVRHRA